MWPVASHQQQVVSKQWSVVRGQQPVISNFRRSAVKPIAKSRMDALLLNALLLGTLLLGTLLLDTCK